jgi:leader peptidase (prepilin peptidase) / N-methyltransferase
MMRTPALGTALVGAAIFAVAAYHLDASMLEFLRVAMLGGALGALTYADLTEHRIPNRIVVPATGACGALLFAEGVPSALFGGGLALVLLMLVLGLLWPTSFGMGDVKLALLVVAGLGDVAVQALVLGLVLAALFGALLLFRQGRSAAALSLPLAPFVASGAAAVMVA